jgi:hypothetical protein
MENFTNIFYIDHSSKYDYYTVELYCSAKMPSLDPCSFDNIYRESPTNINDEILLSDIDSVAFYIKWFALVLESMLA